MPELRRVAADWRFTNELVEADLEVAAVEIMLPKAGDRLPDGTVSREPAPAIATFTEPDKPALRVPRFLVMASVLPAAFLNMRVEAGISRVVVAVRRGMGEAAIWQAGVLPEGEKLGSLAYRELTLTAAAIDITNSDVTAAMLGEVTGGGDYERIATVNVNLAGQPGPTPQPPMTEAEIAAIPGANIVIVSPPA